MADYFTGFWEDNDGEGAVATTIVAEPIGALLDRLRMRLEGVAPGTCIRIDLIAWEGETETSERPIERWACALSACGKPPADNAEDDEIKRRRALWREQFGGGIVQFDSAHRVALKQGSTVAEAQAAGVNAALDAFVRYLERST